ncbi:C40 family peptidase [Candidatus Pelagibacter sp.]|nr:C40 family peptidase [Candidatus Pelagibacter sp.]
MKNNFFFKSNFINIYKKPFKNSEVISQILYGEKFKILSKKKDWLKIKTRFDNYIGYIKSKNYKKNHNPSHKVFNLRATISNKSNNTKTYLPFASRISIIQERKNVVEFEKNKWIKKKDIKKIKHIEKDYLKVLKLFINTKYVWGGKTYLGVDCSAILQLFFYYNDKFYPRDTKDQIKYSKKIKRKIFKKGDIIFWKGHVAICTNSKKLIHAYGPEKKVLVMPIKKTIDRIKKSTNLVIKKISSMKY